MQIYANIDSEQFDQYHRMLYVFCCLSEKCIGTQGAIRCYKCVIPHENNVGMEFATDDMFNDVSDKTDN